MRIVIGMLACGVLATALGWPFYVAPAHDEPRDVDAVYVIGPPTDERIALAEGMVRDGLADTLVVSLGEDPVERSQRPAAVRACEEPQDFAVLCSEPDPFATRGEARWLRDLADEHGWDAVAVVTTTPHLTRTRVIMERCWDGDLAYIDSEERLWPWQWAYQYAYQTAAFAKVAAQDGC
ncbi:YdcF family protein [Demequina iriomotensis]|uniref:YdcF family protein n=1 Tax=Demequina iriomotensis TaxID=1536641 RepID=UPI000781367C|nr:ElyC/SanA/YdcF family protein [Demequina iriomotensis]